MYVIAWEWSAWRDFEPLSEEAQHRIEAAADALAQDPEPPGSKALRGERHRRRIREGPYRIIYRWDRAEGRVVILAVGHRKSVYQ